MTTAFTLIAFGNFAGSGRSTGLSPRCGRSAGARSVPAANRLIRPALARMFFWVAALTVLSGNHAASAEAMEGQYLAGEVVVDAPGIQARIDAGRLTLHADEAPLADVLTAIGQLAGIDVFMQGDLGVLVTVSLVDRPLDGAISNLLRDTSFVLIYGPAPGADTPQPLVEIRVAGRSANRPAPATTSAGDISEDQSEAAIAALQAVMLGLEPAPENGSGLFGDLAGFDANRRLYAMQWLADLGDADAIEALGRFLALDTEPAVRGEAALALGNIGSEAVSQALALGLGDNDPDVRFQVVESLAGVTGLPSTLMLGQILFGEPDPEIRMSALAGLGRSRGEAAWAFLEAATEDAHPEVRKFAIDLMSTWDQKD